MKRFFFHGTWIFKSLTSPCLCASVRKKMCIVHCALCILLLLSGCVYRLGTPYPRDMREVYVPSVINRSDEPAIDSAMTSSLRHEIHREGTLRLVTEPNARVRMNVVVTRVHVNPIGYSPTDTLTPNEYRLFVTADVAFRNLIDGSVIYSGTHVGETTFIMGNHDFVSAKLSHLKKACDDLALRVVDACISTAW